MKKIIFLNDWGDSPFESLMRYKRQTPSGDGVWNELVGTVEIDKADYYIVFDNFPSDEFIDRIPLNKVLFFQREPAVIKKRNKYFENALYYGSYENHHHLSTWQLIEDFVELADRKAKKTKLLSTVTSGKTITEGQRRRLEVIHQLSKVFDNIDIFGKGLSPEIFGNSYKGELNYNGICKIRGLEDYYYSLAFENSSYKNYFTEKFIDPILMWSKPIYWGAQNIAEFFPEESFVFVDIYDDNCIEIILKEINKPVNYDALKEARKLVLFKYNLWAAIEKVINEIEDKNRIYMKEDYYSQIGQDKILDDELFQKKEKGFYVEVGATDGVHFSNTLFFEKFRNWDGICIEPNPIEFKKLEQSGRNCIKENVAISTSKGEVNFLAIDGYGKGLSGIIDNYNTKHINRIENETKETDSKKIVVKVKTVPLSDIFEKHGVSKINYCSVDVEGSEFEVIKSIDFSKVSIDCFTIENNYGIEEIISFLEGKGYIHWKTIQWDEVFVHKSFFKNHEERSVYLDKSEIQKVIKPHFTNLLDIKHGAYKKRVSATELVNSKRIDPMAKYIFARFKEDKINSEWGREVYLEHLRAFNGFVEGDGTGKKGIDAFVSSFENLLASMKLNGFDETKSMLPVSNNLELIEGSHRLGISLYLRHKVPVLIFKNEGWNYNYNFFRDKNLEQKYLDFMALQYIRFNKKLKIVLLFPAAEGNEEKVNEILLEQGEIYYEKEVLLSQSGAILFLTQVYHGEEWLGDIGNGFPGAKDKAGYCFAGNSSLRVYLFENKGEIPITELKEKIRNIYGIGKHSVHINDSFEETELLANILFNQNSIDFLNYASVKNFSNFWMLFEKLKNAVRRENIDTELFALAGSAPLSLLGLREANDIDYISQNDTIYFDDEKISNHVTEKSYYPYSFDDIIFNPQNHFYFSGIKFASLDVIKKMKLRRGEPKDFRDIKLLNNFLENNEELKFYLTYAENMVEKEELDKARQLLQYLDIVYKNNPSVKNNIAVVEYLKGNTEKFYENLLDSLIINPDNEVARENYLTQLSTDVNVNDFAAAPFPLVSVVIPVYNQAEFLSEAVESVVKQTYPYWECIIVNDGSTDNSEEVANRLIEKYSDYNIKLLNKKNGGLADARNFAIASALGDFILPLDSDDIILPEMLKKTVSVLLANPDVSIVGTDTLRFGEVNNSYQTQGLDLNVMKKLDTLNYCSLYRKEVWEKVGGYNRNMVYGYEDWDFWISCAEAGFKEKKVAEYLFKYRIRKNSMLTHSVQKDDLLKARIVLNHPGVYSKEERENALKILRKLDNKKLTDKEKKILDGIQK